MATQTRTRSRRVGLDGITLVEIAFLVEFLQQVPERLDILVVVGDIGVVQIYPVTHLFGQFGPLLGVFHHLAAAGGVVLVHRYLLADVLLGDTQHLLYAEFYGQAVGVPSGFAAYLKSLHGLETAERILDGTCHHVVDTWFAVGRRRSLEEEELRMALTGRHALFKQVLLFPLRQHLTAQLRQVQLFVFIKSFHYMCD